MTRLGVLYPGSSGEEDYARVPLYFPDVHVRIEHTETSDVHAEADLLETADPRHLLAGAERLAKWNPDSVVWACTSGSFVLGLDGAREQARGLEQALGVPATSTSLAFVDALRYLGLARVFIVATYPDDVVDLFAGFLDAAGIELVGRSSAGIMTGAEVGALKGSDVARMLGAGFEPTADALLVPDTALRSLTWIDEFERGAGRTVLTANQVTIWEGLRLAQRTPTHAGLGQLFDRDVQRKLNGVGR